MRPQAADGIVRREERALGFVVVDLLEVVILADGPRPGDRRPGIDRLEEPLQIGDTAASGSSAPLRTREARSSQPQAEMSAIV